MGESGKASKGERVSRRSLVTGGAALLGLGALWRAGQWARRREAPVVVVGAGASAVAAAKALLDARVPVMMLSTGPVFPREPTDDPLIEPPGEALELPASKPFVWSRFRHVGGRTTAWGGGSLRFSAQDFVDGRELGPEHVWPVGYDELAPHYAAMERLLEVTGSAAGLVECPDGQFVRSAGTPALLQRFGEAFARAGAPITELRASRSTALGGRPFAADVFIRRALTASPLFSLRARSMALRVETDAGTNRVSGVTYLNERTGAEVTQPARAVVLAAGTLDSTRVLLASSSQRYPNGLGNASGTLGCYLMDHPMVELSLAFEQPPAELTVHPAGEGVGLVPRFNRHAFENPPGLRGGFQYVALRGEEPTLELWGLAEATPRRDNRVSLTGAKSPQGISLLRADYERPEGDQALARRMVEVALELATATLGKCRIQRVTHKLPGETIHEVGTCRMGADPRSSMLDGFCRSHEVRGLLVVDGSVFPTHPEKNPTLTLMALAHRAGARLAVDLRA